MVINQEAPLQTSRPLRAAWFFPLSKSFCACKSWLGHFMHSCSLMGLFCSQDRSLHCCWLCTGLVAFTQLTSLKSGLVTSSGAAGFTNSICRHDIDKLFQCISSSKKIISRPSCPEELALLYLASLTPHGTFTSCTGILKTSAQNAWIRDPAICSMMDLRCICVKIRDENAG